MSLFDWFDNRRKLKLLTTQKYRYPKFYGNKGLWVSCDNCGNIIYIKQLKQKQRICPKCNFYLKMPSMERISCLVDKSSWISLDNHLSPVDPLQFYDKKNYKDRLLETQKRTGLKDAIQTGLATLNGYEIALGVMDFEFMGGSMGSVVGEKITRLIETATNLSLPVLLICASGGARMQEGILSLMQMAKISSALQKHQLEHSLLYIPILTSPTTGGVTASFAMLGDLILAEPKALIGFAGRRVIEQTLNEKLPKDFQTSEYLLNHGLVDLIVPRLYLKQALTEIFALYKIKNKNH
uniref:Acetyl-coenzyme A carboxylase carboxyl transferase subunit beta, chloroplastic n=1 Tax=Verdigellas peltata TaxID=542676 RepID=A0A170TN25_9VIRI|nr:beta subunit of acetyl-CoA carboxylase carboxytransferase [Verdigellas peltata]CZF96652.1 beta subunit of acetyl-CoA carboxylase carboxytransferase [Verdigellas peltata]